MFTESEYHDSSCWTHSEWDDLTQQFCISSFVSFSQRQQHSFVNKVKIVYFPVLKLPYVLISPVLKNAQETSSLTSVKLQFKKKDL